MDKIRNALKCVNCRETLISPVVLPCGHMICQSHTQSANDQLICSECGTYFPNKGFVVIKAFSDIIESELTDLDFGNYHKKAADKCEELKNRLEKNTLIFNDSDYFIHETISELKNRVMLKSEKLKIRIDEITREFIGDLAEYEKRCKINCEDKNSNTDFVSSLNEFKQYNSETKKSYQMWSSELNKLKVDVDKWVKIEKECEKTLKDMNKKVKQFESELFLSELDFTKFRVDSFEKANIHFIPRQKVNIFYFRFFFHN